MDFYTFAFYTYQSSNAVFALYAVNVIYFILLYGHSIHNADNFLRQLYDSHPHKLVLQNQQKVLCICRHHVRRLAEVLSQTLGDLSDIAYLAIRCVGQAFSAQPIELSKVNRLVT